MLLPANASLIISVARQLIKLGNRVDNLLAEKTAVQSALVLAMPCVRIDDIVKQKRLVAATLESTRGSTPDPFGDDRVILVAELTKDPVSADFDRLCAKYFPDAASFEIVDPDAAYLAKLKQAFPGADWKDPAVRLAAFAIAAGPDNREISYSARVALSVADTFLELGAENAASLVRDEKLGKILALVLQRLAEPEWEQFENWNPLLQSVVRGVLNAALDVGGQFPPENRWLTGVLDALLAARKDAAVPDDFVLGLVRGESFPSLLSHGLLVASERLGDDKAGTFEKVAADVLSEGAKLIKTGGNTDFRTFFNDHWGDLLRAGLTSLDKHGDSLLADQQPLLRSVLKAMVQRLAQTPDAGFLTHEILFRLTDAAIGAVADNPDEVDGLVDKPWFADLVNTAAQTAQQLTAQKLFTKEAAEALTLGAIEVLGRHPNLIVRRQGLPLTVVTQVLQSVAQLPRLEARAVGNAAIRAAIDALAANPALAAGKFGPAIDAATATVVGLLESQSLDATSASEIAAAAIEAIAGDPRVFADLDKNVAGAVVTAVRKAVPDAEAQSWAGPLLVDLARAALRVVGRVGLERSRSNSLQAFGEQLQQTLSAGLDLAADQLGRSVDQDDLVPVVAGLLERALRGQLQALDPTAKEFTDTFDALAAALPRR